MDLAPPPLVRQVGEANQWSDFDSVTKIVALTFGPFYSKWVYGEDLDDLLSPFGSTTLLECHDLPQDGEPLTQIKIFVGNQTEVPLENVKAFFHHNSFVTDRTWQYDLVIMVGFNRATDVPVDIPAHFMPHLVNIYGLTGNTIGECPEDAILDNHQFRAVCNQCIQRKDRCSMPRDDQCKKCEGGQCEPNVEAEIMALQKLMAERMVSKAPFLCPALQYLFAMVSTASGLKTTYSTVSKMHLRSIILDEVIFGHHQASLDRIKAECKSWQTVSIQNGRLKIDDSSEMGARLGWSVRKVKKGQYGRAKLDVGNCFNSFGVGNPDDLICMFNSAIATPGEVIVRDLAMWDKHLMSIGSRFVMMAEVVGIDEFRITVGWA
jgi:hypothetical protein